MKFLLNNVDSRSELIEKLRSLCPFVLIGDDDRSANKFGIIRVGEFSIGLCYSDTGIPPSIIFDGDRDRVWIGYGSNLSILDLGDSIVKCSVRLDSVIHEISCIMHDGSVVVVHELGATRVDSGAHVLWKVATDDVVTDFEDHGDRIALATERGPVVFRKFDGKTF